MLNVFQHNSDNKKIVRYRTGYVKEASSNQIPFKFYRLEREDIIKQSYLKNVDLQSHQLVIRTLSDYNFNINTRIVIDNIQYTVESFYTEEQENSNGLFRKRVKPFKYLVLKR